MRVVAPCALVAALIVSAATAVAQERREVVVERDVVYGQAGDLPLKLDIARLAKPGDEKRPAIVWIHGGGWSGGNKSGGLGGLQPLVAAGDYVGFSVEYRLSNVAAWPAQIHDCKAAIRWIRANADKYGVDPQRIGVWGSSAGGHLVSMLGTSGGVKELEGENGSPDASGQVACVVNYCGPSDFLAFAEKNPRVDHAASAISKLLGGSISELKALAKQASPITYASSDDPPFLVVHGTKDDVVPIDQAERFYAALKKADVDATIIRIDGGGHGISGPEVSRRVRAFLDKHLRNQDVEVSGGTILQGS